MDSQYTIPITPTVSKQALTQTTQIYYDLEPNECGTIDSLCVRFTIRAINDTYLVDPFKYFREIEIRAEKGTGDVLQRIYPECMKLFYWQVFNEEERKMWAELGNFTILVDPKTGRESIAITEKNLILQVKLVMYFPLRIMFLKQGQLNKDI